MDVKAPPRKTVSIVPVIQGSAAWLTSAATFVGAHLNDPYFNQFRVVTQTAPVYLVRQSPAQEYMMVTPEPAV